MGSFVPPASSRRWPTPRRRCAAHVGLPGVAITALAPNLRGAQAAYAAGAHRISIPVSVSEGHSRANLNRSPAEQVAEVGRIVAWVRAPAAPMAVAAACSTAFGCSIDGAVPEAGGAGVAAGLAAAGVEAISLADTVGYAHPAQIRSLVRAVRAAKSAPSWTTCTCTTPWAWGWPTRWPGWRRASAPSTARWPAWAAARTRPGASGNIVTEDLVFMLESMGFATGIDLDRLVAARGPAGGRAARRARCMAASPGPACPRPSGSRRERTAALGLRVVEFTHMVMGPACGLVLADLGADVIKVEPPPEGDNTRRLGGSGAGFFAIMNRNKRSWWWT